VAEGIDVEAADLGLTELEQTHLSELHELAAAAGVPRFRTLRREELAAAINSALSAEVRTETEVEREEQEQHLYAIIRLARGGRWTPAPKPDQVAVEKIVSSEQEAEREADRLNALPESEAGASYFWRAAPLDQAE
jgi:hypothetical protein